MNLSTLRPRGRLTLGAIVKYLVPGMVGNIRIDECTLLDFYNETMGVEYEHIYSEMLDEECADAIANFSQTWSRACVDDDFTIGNVLVVLFRSKIDLDIQRVMRGFCVNL